MGVLSDLAWWLCGLIQLAAFGVCRWTYRQLRTLWNSLRTTPVAFWIGLLIFLAVIYSAIPKAGGWRLRLLTYAICGLACLALWHRRPLAHERGKPGPVLG